MEHRQLGGSGLRVPVLTFGTGTFGGTSEFFKAWGDTDAAAARKLVDVCLDAGSTMFDSADVYSDGLAERVLGAAIKGAQPTAHLDQGDLPLGDGPNDVGSSRHIWSSRSRQPAAARHRLHRPLPTAWLRRQDPVEETLRTLDDLVRAGKIRYVGCSNFSGWHLMKSLAVSDRYGLARHVAHQAYYSLIGRDYEWELMPLGLDQKVGAVVWSPLGWGRLTGKIRRGQPLPKVSRLHKTKDDGRRSMTSTCTGSSTHSMRSPRRPARACRRSPSTGCCSGRRSRPSSSAPAT